MIRNWLGRGSSIRLQNLNLLNLNDEIQKLGVELSYISFGCLGLIKIIFKLIITSNV